MTSSNPNGSTESGELTVDGTNTTLKLRALAVSTTFIKAWTFANPGTWIMNEVPIVPQGSSEQSGGQCDGVSPLVSWSEDDNGGISMTATCDAAKVINLEIFDTEGNTLLAAQTLIEPGVVSSGFSDLRGLSKAELRYRAWHGCDLPDGLKCGDTTEGVIASISGDGSNPSANSTSTTVASSEEVGPQPVPVGLLSPVPTTSGEGEAPQVLPVAQIVVDPSVVILLCEQDCVDKIADRTGVEDGFVEMRVDGGEWVPALGGIIPVGDALVPVEFRATPLEGEPVVLAADFVGKGRSIREVTTVKPSGEIVDSTGEVVSTVPVYETVTTDGLPWRNIIIGVVLLLLIAVVVISMLKRKQRLVSSVDDSSSKV